MPLLESSIGAQRRDNGGPDNPNRQADTVRFFPGARAAEETDPLLTETFWSRIRRQNPQTYTGTVNDLNVTVSAENLDHLDPAAIDRIPVSIEYLLGNAISGDTILVFD